MRTTVPGTCVHITISTNGAHTVPAPRLASTTLLAARAAAAQAAAARTAAPAGSSRLGRRRLGRLRPGRWRLGRLQTRPAAARVAAARARASFERSGGSICSDGGGSGGGAMRLAATWVAALHTRWSSGEGECRAWPKRPTLGSHGFVVHTPAAPISCEILPRGAHPVEGGAGRCRVVARAYVS